MNNILKNKKGVLLGALAVLSILSLLYIFSHLSSKQEVLTPPKNTTQATYDSIIPGVSTKEDVINKFGKPINTDPALLEFRSLSPNRNNQVEISQDKVSLVKEIITLKDTRRTTDVINSYGVAQKILYGPYSDTGFYLFVYPTNGIAYIGHPESGLLLEIWYFPPTNIPDFIANYAEGYSESFQESGPENLN
jgi:hypothetical protein